MAKSRNQVLAYNKKFTVLCIKIISVSMPSPFMATGFPRPPVDSRPWHYDDV